MTLTEMAKHPRADKRIEARKRMAMNEQLRQELGRNVRRWWLEKEAAE